MEPITGFRGPYKFLSNFYISPDGFCAELHYQADKTDDGMAKNIILHSTPGRAKNLGREVKLRPGFEAQKTDVMKSILRIKFTDPQLRQQLLDTGDAELVEGNYWHDNFWGSCSCEKCAGKEKINALGRLLMEIRDDLRK